MTDTPPPDGRPSHPVPNESKSEVARLMEQIEAEFQSGMQALHGLAQGTGQHAFITQRMENIGGLHEQLRTLIGDKATPIILDKLDQWEQAKRHVRQEGKVPISE